MTAAQQLANWAVAAEFSNATTARKAVVDAIIDTLGCIHAGWRDPVCERTLRVAQTWGTGDATVIASPVRLAAPSAAFVNGTAAHALDYDDYEVIGTTHNSAAILPALLALAETHGRTGRDLIDAYIVGFETITQIGHAIGYGHYTTGWHATSTTGTIGAAAACARLLGLDAASTATALAIAASMAGGLKSNFGTDTKPVHAGLAAKSGIIAAQLAASGVSANPGALDAPHGFLDIMNKQTSPGFAGPLSRLGKVLAVDEFGIVPKPYPSCSYTHRPIDAMLALLPQIADLAAIDHVNIKVPRSFYQVSSKHDPKTPPEARFSMTWCVAVAAIEGRVQIGHFEPGALARTDLRTLENRSSVETYIPEDGESDLVETAPDTVTVKLKTGETLASTIGKIRGSPQWPMTAAERHTKFTDCMSGHMDEGQSAKVFEQLQGFDCDQPVGKLLKALERFTL